MTAPSLTPPRALVTGGAGFIGSHLRARLAQRGVQCTVLDLVQPAVLASSERFIRGDVRNPEVVARAMEQVDIVYHLAAAHHDFGIDPATFQTVNVTGMQVLCEAAQFAGVRRVVFTSSVAVYGGETPGADETSTPHPEGPYGRTKLEAEAVLKAWGVGTPQHSAIILRPAVVYGPGSFANMFSLVRQIHRGRFALVGAGANIKSVVFVENLLDMIDFLVERTVDGEVVTFNAVDAPDLTSRQIATVLSEAVKRPRIPSLPLGIARVVALPFDLLTALSGRDFGFSTARLEKFALKETRFSGSALRALGYRQRIGAEDGLRAMAQWYVEHGVHVPSAPRHLPPATVVM